MKYALITGITGQDGSYLTELLLEKEYKVYGIIRRASSINTQRINHLFNHENLVLRYGDMTDPQCFINVLGEMNVENPERIEIYNLAAQSHVKVSFENPHYTGMADGMGVLNILEAIRVLRIQDKTRFYQASTSELFGQVQEVPQKETTPFHPRSPYGVAKLYGLWIVKNYRESYGFYATNGILFNHESPRRGPTFVTRKITIGLGKICRGEMDTLVMGNIDSLRDWGHAKDYVRGMWQILQQDQPDDYVLSTQEMHSVREFIEKSFALKGFDIVWEGEGVNEIGIDKKSGKVLIRISEKYFRPAEVEQLLGDSTKARSQLGWAPEYSFDDLVKEMVEHDSEKLYEF